MHNTPWKQRHTHVHSMAMSTKWIAVLVVILVTFASLGHCRKELGPSKGKTRKTKPTSLIQSLVTERAVEATTEDVLLKNETTSDFEDNPMSVTEPLNETSNSTETINGTSMITVEDVEEFDEGVFEEEDQDTTAISTLQEDEPTIFSWIYDRILYAIESYSSSNSLWDWITGLGGGGGGGLVEEGRKRSRGRRKGQVHSISRSALLDPLKFNPLADAIIEFFEPYGFKPYPDPYEPQHMDKDDIWKFAINWGLGFGLVSLFWRSYDLPLPFGIYQKFGIIDGVPGLDLDSLDDEEEYEEGKEEKEEDEEKEEEEDPYEDGEEEGDEDEDDDPHDDEEGDDHEEDEEDDEDDEENYYKVGEEEKEEEREESFAVFRQKNPDGNDDDHLFHDDDEEPDDSVEDGEDVDYGDDDGSEDGVSSYTFYNIPGEEDEDGHETGEHGVNGDDNSLEEGNTEALGQEDHTSSYTSYETSSANRRVDQQRHPSETSHNGRPDQKKRPSQTSHNRRADQQKQTSQNNHNRRADQQKHRSQDSHDTRRWSKKSKLPERPRMFRRNSNRYFPGKPYASTSTTTTTTTTARPPQRQSNPPAGLPRRRSPGNLNERVPPPGISGINTSGNVAGIRPFFHGNPPPRRPGNAFRRLVPRPTPSPSSSSSSFFPFSLFK